MMTEQRFFDRQPDKLPPTLPAGTRNRSLTPHGACVATSELRLDEANQWYTGLWAMPGVASYEGSLSPKNIDWTSVAMPDTCECAACGERKLKDCFGSDWSIEDVAQGVVGAKVPLCRGCWATPLDVVRERICDRRAALSKPESDSNRPIQAGDWVECVYDANCRADCCVYIGERYQVADVSPVMERVSLVGVQDAGLCGWNMSRFKRIDGPHLDNHVAAHEGPVKETRDGHGNIDTVPLCSTPACSSRGVAATHSGMCVYCAHRVSRVEYTSPLSWQVDANEEARARMAAMARAERPRQTATSRELAKPHPWEGDWE